MRKSSSSQTPTENVFKTIVKGVVREEIADLATKSELANLKTELKVELAFTKQDILSGVEEMFQKYRDELSTKLDYARALARRAERAVVSVYAKSPNHLRPNHLFSYLNRLSSFLFALARLVNFRLKLKEKNPRYR